MLRHDNTSLINTAYWIFDSYAIMVMNTACQMYDRHKCTINSINMHSWHNWIWVSSITCLTKDWIFESLNLWLICLIKPTTKYVLFSYSNSDKHDNLFIQEHVKRNNFWISFITTQTLTLAMFNPQPEILCESQLSRRLCDLDGESSLRGSNFHRRHTQFPLWKQKLKEKRVGKIEIKHTHQRPAQRGEAWVSRTTDGWCFEHCPSSLSPPRTLI